MRGSTLDVRLQSKIFIMAVDPKHGHSNEPERANLDIYDDFKLKKPFSPHGLYKNISALYLHLAYHNKEIEEIIQVIVLI